MRRPLLFLCVCLFVIIALGMQIFSPPPLNGIYAGRAGEELILSGQVYDKEYRENNGEEVLVLYLQSIHFQKEGITSYQKSFQDFFSTNNYPKKKIRCELYMDNLESINTYARDESGAASGFDLLRMGAWVTVRGVWSDFAYATNPGEFDLANYYGIEGICGNLKEAQVLDISRGYWPVRETLFRLRSRLVNHLYAAFPPKEASILAKMLLGENGGLDKEVRDLYQANGIVHILSISGLHISMLGMGLYRLLRKCRVPMKLAAVLGGILIILYGMLTGFGVSACRAIGMYLIHMLGEIWGKSYDMLTAMGVLCVTLLAENPRLVYHSGYLLSFSSVCGVGLLAPFLQGAGGLYTSPVPEQNGRLKSWFFNIQNWLMVRPYDRKTIKWLKHKLVKIGGAFRVSLSVTLFTLPLQLFFFYKIPVYSVFLNLLVIPFVSVVMVIGFAVMIVPGLTFLCPVESLIFAWFEWLCRMFEKLPGHTLTVGRPDMWKILLYYALLLLLICFGRRLRKCVQVVVPAALVLFMLLKTGSESRITFLDVGQGDCICVQTAEGRCFLFDCGSSNKSNVGENILVPFLQYQGIDMVDGVFLSHPDTDHTNGVMALLQEENICVKNIYLPDVQEAKAAFKEMLENPEGMGSAWSAEETGIAEGFSKDRKSGEGLGNGTFNLSYISAGMFLELPDIKITCLHPASDFQGEDNASSACYYLELEGVDILLTGDIEGVGEERLVQELEKQGIMSVDILKVAHHGSRNSTSEDFLSITHPRIAIISCGRNNWYGHPHQETLERLLAVDSFVLTTKECGAIMLDLDEQTIRLSYFLKDRMEK